MSRESVTISMPDGSCTASLHIGDGESPGVLMYPDAAGPREVFRAMADRLAALGYVVLLPDIYYRSAPYPPFSVTSVFADPAERKRMGTVAGLLTNDRVRSDAAAYADFLLARSAGDSIGTTGYCLGGRMSLIAATGLGARAAACASFHGGGLAVEGDPSSPHLAVSSISAQVYVAGAADDPHFTAAQASFLDSALTLAGVSHTVEFYDAAHGFAVPDNPTYSPAAADRHWAALTDLYATTLGPR